MRSTVTKRLARLLALSMALSLAFAAFAPVAFAEEEPEPQAYAPDAFESNDTLDTATTIGFPFCISNATISSNTDIDYYATTLDETTTLNITLMQPKEKDVAYYLALCSVEECEGNNWLTSENNGDQMLHVDNLDAGIYIIRVSRGGEYYSDMPYTLRVNAQAKEAPDFSELHLARYVLGADSFFRYSDYGFDAGGGEKNAMGYFSSWKGGLLESEDPYPENTQSEEKDKFRYHSFKAKEGIKPRLSLLQSIMLPKYTQPNDEYTRNIYKAALYCYGAVEI